MRRIWERRDGGLWWGGVGWTVEGFKYTWEHRKVIWEMGKGLNEMEDS